MTPEDRARLEAALNDLIDSGNIDHHDVRLDEPGSVQRISVSAQLEPGDR